jgi:hypothetical protein
MLLGYLEGFTYVMTGVGTGIPDFVFWAVMAPTIMGMLVFALVYRVFTGVGFTFHQYLIATSFALCIAVIGTVTVASEVLPGPTSLIVPIAVAFIGGRYFTLRVSNA